MGERTVGTRPVAGGTVIGSTVGTVEGSTVGTVSITVRYFAAARAAAGCPEERLVIAAPATIQDVLTAARGRHGARLSTVLARCSYLLDEVAVHGGDTPVSSGSVVDVLPPFAGG